MYARSQAKEGLHFKLIEANIKRLGSKVVLCVLANGVAENEAASILSSALTVIGRLGEPMESIPHPYRVVENAREACGPMHRFNHNQESYVTFSVAVRLTYLWLAV